MFVVIILIVDTDGPAHNRVPLEGLQVHQGVPHGDWLPRVSDAVPPVGAPTLLHLGAYFQGTYQLIPPDTETNTLLRAVRVSSPLSFNLFLQYQQNKR